MSAGKLVAGKLGEEDTGVGMSDAGTDGNGATDMKDRVGTKTWVGTTKTEDSGEGSGEEDSGEEDSGEEKVGARNADVEESGTVL